MFQTFEPIMAALAMFAMGHRVPDPVVVELNRAGPTPVATLFFAGEADVEWWADRVGEPRTHFDHDQIVWEGWIIRLRVVELAGKR